MANRRVLQTVVPLFLGLVAAGWYSHAADDKDQADFSLPNARARRDAAKAVYEGTWQRHLQEPGAVPFDLGYFHDWSVRWMQAECDLNPAKDAQIAAHEGHLKRMELWKGQRDKAWKEGQAAAYEVRAAEFYSLEAEDWLTAKAKGR